MRRLAQAILASALIVSSAANAQQVAPRAWTIEWTNTDFSKSSVDFDEVFSGGPPKDGIPALDGATFISVSEEREIEAREPVVTVELDGQEPRAYPIRYLTWHEIVNDRIGDVPVSVTFCPLCNSAIVFDGRAAGKELTFGVSGKLRNSDMIMYDRQTESWWQQFTGEGVVGALNGTVLTILPSWMESFAEYKDRNPNGLIMAQPTAARPYGANPYTGYDGSFKPFLYNGENPPHGIKPLARVVRVGALAWPVERLSTAGEIVEDGIRITWTEGQASALDTRRIADGREVGTIRVYDAVTGAPLPHEVVFAFAFHAFEPEGIWKLGEG